MSEPIPFVDLKAQYLSIPSDIDQAILSVVRSGNFVGGEVVQKFEKAFAKFVGCSYCLSCGNGTDALELALRALGLGMGDEVIVPAMSWVATAAAVNNVGAEPVFVDVLESEYTIDPKQVEKAISSRTKAIIPVHLYGLPARMPEIMQIAEKHNLKVIEDCAQAHGAKIGERHAGIFGHCGIFSFYPTKNLGAYGDAGGIVTNNKELAEQCRMMGNHGQLTKHSHKILGRNSRLDTLQAAILSAKLPHLKEWTQKRNQAAKWYGKYLGEGVVKPLVPENFYHVYHLYVVRTSRRDALMKALDSARISYSVHYPVPLPFVDAYRYQGKFPEDFPVASRLAQEIISMPMFPEMSEEQVKTVAEVVNQHHGF